MNDTRRPRKRREVSASLGGTKEMPDTDDLALWHALTQQMTSYWADVDYNGGSRAHQFYLPEALFAGGNNRFEGEEKIPAFYARRRQPRTTTTPHLVRHLRGLPVDPQSARSVP